MTGKKSTELPKPLILIVDDVPKNLQVLGTILKEKEYEVAAATGGKQALTMVEARMPELILLDVMMPDPDGFETCKTLKDSGKTKNIPIIFLTAKTEAEDIVQGFEAGAVDYITKPFNRAELLARVHTHLALQQAQQEIIQLEKQNAVFAMAVTAGHEVNQPLTALQGYFDLYKSTLAPDRVTEKQQLYLGKMKNSIKKVGALLKKFTDADTVRFENYIGEKKMVVFD